MQMVGEPRPYPSYTSAWATIHITLHRPLNFCASAIVGSGALAPAAAAADSASRAHPNQGGRLKRAQCNIMKGESLLAAPVGPIGPGNDAEAAAPPIPPKFWNMTPGKKYLFAAHAARASGKRPHLGFSTTHFNLTSMKSESGLNSFTVPPLRSTSEVDGEDGLAQVDCSGR